MYFNYLDDEKREAPINPQTPAASEIPHQIPANREGSVSEEVQQAFAEQAESAFGAEDSEKTVQSKPCPEPAAGDNRILAKPEMVSGETMGNSVEFVIGATVLGIVGGGFLLTALFLFGMYFMNGLVKGLLLYVLCAAVMVLAEGLLYRRIKWLGVTLSSIAAAGFYVSTVINYNVLHNFVWWAALGVTFFISVFEICWSKKRESVTYRIIEILAMYFCPLMISSVLVFRGELLQREFVIFAVAIFVLNVLCASLQLDKHYEAVNIVHMASNTFFTILAYEVWSWTDLPVRYESLSEVWQYPVFVALSLIILHQIFVKQTRKREIGQSNLGIKITYLICGAIYWILVLDATDLQSFLTRGAAEEASNLFLWIRLAEDGVLLMVGVTAMLLLRKRRERWFIWYLVNGLIFSVHLFQAEGWEPVLCMSALLVCNKILARKQEKMLKILDAALTTFVCLYVCFRYDAETAILPSVLLLLSVFWIRYWKGYFETILTLTIAFYTAMNMLPMLKLPVFIGVLFVGMLIFNQVKMWRHERIGIYNWCMIAGQMIGLCALLNPVYRNSYFTYFCVLIFGLATVTVCFQEKYRIGIKSNAMAMALFLTYMGAVVRTNYPIANSILLMLIALGSVGAGFYQNKKSVRIYGLLLSLTVCGKMIVYDFRGANMLQRTILFFVAGVIALGIAAIYMVLEHKRNGKERSL